ncbi:MAG: hypothetical protein ACKVQC_00985 [Elusimicrobiota bacterium]
MRKLNNGVIKANGNIVGRVVDKFRDEGYLAYIVSRPKGKIIVIKPSLTKCLSLRYKMMQDIKFQRVLEGILSSHGLDNRVDQRRLDYGVMLLSIRVYQFIPQLT